MAALLILPAHFASATETDTDAAVIPFEAINYFVARHFNAYSAAATGFLPPDTPLPATVEVAIPAGSEIMWFSEVSGGPIQNDPEFTAPFNMRTENGLDIYTVTLEHYPVVQIEYNLDNNDPNERIATGQYRISMAYTPATDTPILRLMTNLPAETVVNDQDVTFMGEDADGYLVFFRIYNDVPAFQPVTGEITYNPPAGTGFIAQGGSLLGGFTVVILGVMGVVVAALAFIVYSNKRKQA